MVLPVWPGTNVSWVAQNAEWKVQNRRLPNRKLPLPVEMPALHFARLVEARRPAEPQDVAGELVDRFVASTLVAGRVLPC